MRSTICIFRSKSNGSFRSAQPINFQFIDVLKGVQIETNVKLWSTDKNRTRSKKIKETCLKREVSEFQKN